MYIRCASGAETDAYLVHISKAKYCRQYPLPHLQQFYLGSMTLLLKSAGSYLSHHTSTYTFADPSSFLGVFSYRHVVDRHVSLIIMLLFAFPQY